MLCFSLKLLYYLLTCVHPFSPMHQLRTLNQIPTTMIQTLFSKRVSSLFKLAFLAVLLLLISFDWTNAQTTISTTNSFTNQSTVSTVTFNFQNTNNFPVVITNMEGILSSYGLVSTEMWYKTSAINGMPGLINAGNGWILSASASINGILDTLDNATQPLFNILNLTIPANTTYGIAVAAYNTTGGAQRTGSAASAVSVSTSGCNFLSGDNVGYAAINATPQAPALTPKGWIGKITFIPDGACTGTPVAAVASGPSNICSGASFSLSASAYAVGGSIGYQWQRYNTTTLAWEDITAATTPNYTLTITVSTQFRLKTDCISTGAFSVSNAITVNIGTGLAGGVYTINKNAPSSVTNFISFTGAAAAMICGITGPVTLNVAPGSGPYNESVIFNNIPSTSAVNRVRINGNGETIQSVSPSAYQGVVHINGTKYLIIDSLTVRSLSADAIGISFADSSTHDSIMHCFVDMRSIGTAATSQSTGIGLCFYNNAPSVIYYVNHCYIGYNHILGTTGAGGPEYGILDGGYNNGNLGPFGWGNVIVYNDIENVHTIGISSAGSDGSVIAYNNIHADNKVNGASNFWGITCWTGYLESGGTSQPQRTVVGNRIHNPCTTNTVTNFTGIEVQNDWGGLFSGHTRNTLIANNAIYNVNADLGSTIGIYLGVGGYNLGTPNNDTIQVYHNTVNINQTASASTTSSIAGITYQDNYYGLASTDIESVYMKNNLITISSAATTINKYAFVYTNPVGNITLNLNAQRNDVYITGTGTGYYCVFNGNNYLSYFAFQSFMPGQEMGTISADPQYTDATTGNLSPLNLSLFGNGLNLQSIVPADILGRQRSATPTVGAFEVGVDAGVIGLLSPVDTYCSSTKMVSVAIHNFGDLTFNSIQVNWSLNGAIQPPASYSGTLLPGNTATVNLGNGLFMPATPVTIKAWTTLPGGLQDIMPGNDTLAITTQSTTSLPVDIGPNDTICTGNTITLDAGLPGSQYLWDNNTNTEFRTIQNAGTYYVKVIAFDGCIGVDTMRLYLRPLPVEDLGPQQAICEGSSTTLDAGHPGDTYLWDNGTTGQTRVVDTAGNYEVQVIDPFGCHGVGDVVVIMKEMPSIAGINATHADSGLYTFFPIDPLYVINYTWDFGDTTATAMGYMVQHAYRYNGIYTVKLSLEGECTGLIIHDEKTVDVFNAPGDDGTGIANTALERAISVYPNPAKNLLSIANKSEANMNRIVVYNALGQQVINEPADGAKQHQLYTGALANGLYSIRVETSNGMFIQKFEVIK
jgi:hypothetical protein